MGVAEGLSKRARIFAVLPFALALGWLILLYAARNGSGASMSLRALSAGPFVLLGALLAAGALATTRRASAAWLAPCAWAPLAVVAPWAVVPGRLGVGHGEFLFFVHWLTRYPNFGPINYEVLLGMGALLGACAMPALAAALVVWRPQTRASTLAILFALELVAYLPVFWRLDGEQLIYGAMVIAHGPVDLFATGPPPPWWANLPIALVIAAGALVRLIAAVSMLGLFFATARHERRTNFFLRHSGTPVFRPQILRAAGSSHHTKGTSRHRTRSR